MKFDRRKFRDWLASKPATAHVGTGRDHCGCPLATWYTEVDGNDVVIFQSDHGRYQADRGYSKRDLPDWANQFAGDIDSLGAQPVSAKQALAILDEITEPRHD